eukprot:293067-Chlamydomonas_euryale.AAC.1
MAPKADKGSLPKSHPLPISEDDFQVVHAARRVAGGRRAGIRKRKAQHGDALGLGGDAHPGDGGDARSEHRVKPRL